MKRQQIPETLLKLSLRLIHNTQLLNMFAMLLAALAFSCGPKQVSGMNDSASSSSLSLAASAATATLGSQLTLAASGGNAPYTFKILSGLGSIYSNGIASAMYTAPSAGSGLVQIQVTDSQGSVAVTGFNLSGTAILLTPQNQTIGFGQTSTFTVTGGTPPYNYTVGTANGGTFASTGYTTGSNVFTAGSVAETVLINVTDSSQPANTNSTYVYVQGASGNTGTCDGTFQFTENGTAGTMTLVENANGAISGQISLSNGTIQAVLGQCTMTNIQFTVNNNWVFTGTINMSSNNPGHVFFTAGTYVVGATTYSWSGSD